MGSGFKNFTAASVLTASDVNNYLMEQSVMSFASTGARDTQIISPEDGMVAYIGSNDSSEGIYSWNGTKWVAVAKTHSVSAYTPALTASATSPTLGSGSAAYGTYVKLGNWITGTGVVAFGSSGTAAGSGDYFITVPENLASGTFCGGHGYAYDVSATAWRTFVLEAAGTNKFYMNMGSSGRITSGTFPWAAYDQMQINFSYQVAN